MINKLNIPTGIPFVLTLDKDNLKAKGQTKFLADDETVKKATEKVAKISMKWKKSPKSHAALEKVAKNFNVLKKGP